MLRATNCFVAGRLPHPAPGQDEVAVAAQRGWIAGLRRAFARVVKRMVSRCAKLLPKSVKSFVKKTPLAAPFIPEASDDHCRI